MSVLEDLKSGFSAILDEQIKLNDELGSLFLSEYHHAKHLALLLRLDENLREKVEHARTFDVKNKCQTSVEAVIENFESFMIQYYEFGEGISLFDGKSASSYTREDGVEQ